MTTPGQTRRFTIAIATDDDLDGVYFTIQALRLYHPEIADRTEILVIGNHPGGACAGPLKSLEDCIPGYRYIPNADVKGTAVRDLVFREARGEFVVCIDCTIMVAPGALKCLYDYFDVHPDCNDLLQGPLLHDDMKTMATHLSPEWEAGMYGRFVADDSESAGIDGEPFEIQMQSLELFACRRAVWPGLNPAFRGLGGEEGYIHEKVRRRGGRTICLPFLSWLRRSNRSLERRYPRNWDDLIWNYIVGRRELDMVTKDIREHFVELLGAEAADRIFERIEAELPSAYRLDVNPCNGALRVHHGSGDVFAPIWDEASLDRQRHLLRRICGLAQRLDIRLYLYWGSLLGHVRDGGIIPWDDDVDLALFDSGDLPRLIEALEAEGLQIWDMKSHVKICDGSYQRTSRLKYTWPAVDIFSYSLDPGDIEQEARASNQPSHYVLPQREVVLPGRPTQFEGAKVWQPEQPLAILDKHYRGWRDFEETTAWSHVKEGPFRQWFRRPIVTDAAGHKVAVAHGPPALSGPL
jgi:LicD family